MQAITELIVANVYSKYPAVALLTDLREHWQFFCLEVEQIVDWVFDLKCGISMLETFIHQPNPNQPNPNHPTGQPTPVAPYRIVSRIRNVSYPISKAEAFKICMGKIQDTIELWCPDVSIGWDGITQRRRGPVKVVHS